MSEIKFSNAGDLLPVKIVLDQYMGQKKVANIFASQGIPLEIIGRSDLFLPFSKVCSLNEKAARALGDPGFGAYCGRLWGYEMLGPYGEYAMAAPNLEQCLNRLIAAIHMYENGSFGSLTRNGELVKFSYFICLEKPVGRRHITDFSIGVLLNVVQHYTGENWLPVRMETDVPKGKYSGLHEEYYGVPVEPGKVALSLIFSVKDLTTPNPHQDTAFTDYTLRDLGTLIEENPPSSIIDSVTQVVRTRLLAGTVDLEGTARHLSFGVRSMQRRLAVEGESFRDILARERFSRAIDLLSETDNAITEIAKKLGYEYVGDFTRAFTKAKGSPPSEFRQSRRCTE